MKAYLRSAAFVGIVLLGCQFSRAAVRLPFVFTHHMVLQRDATAPVWGTAEPGEVVEVRFGDQTKQATAGDDGRWRVDLDPLSLGDPRELRVRGDRSNQPVVVRDVLVGDVWICSGQSNMEWPIRATANADLDILAADRPNIRLLRVKHVGSQQPRDDVDAAWTLCTPETAKGFSAVGYHFGRQLQHSLGVPIGLIDNSWGGSACEAWAPLEKLEENAVFAPYLGTWNAAAAEADEATLSSEYEAQLAEFYLRRDAAYAAGEPLPERPWIGNKLFHQHRPANLYNARVLPLTPFAIQGTIWYQGESNAGRNDSYRELFGLTIRSWREAWGQGDFPFYWVQLADFRQEVDAPVEAADWPLLREAQSEVAVDLPNTGQAVIIDLGEANDIHPRNKRDVGLRLARLALSETYDKPITGRSPVALGVSVDGNRATVTFSDVGDGLKTFDGAAAAGFALAGEDRVFHSAKAEIVDKDKIVLESTAVPSPVAVRYAWANNPVVNTFSTPARLPITPFRSDDWPRSE